MVPLFTTNNILNYVVDCLTSALPMKSDITSVGLTNPCTRKYPSWLIIIAISFPKENISLFIQINIPLKTYIDQLSLQMLWHAIQCNALPQLSTPIVHVQFFKQRTNHQWCTLLPNFIRYSDALTYIRKLNEACRKLDNK